MSTFQRIDIIVNNAGVVITNDFADLTLADLDTCLGVHVRGAFLVSQAAWPYLAKAGYGRILNVGSGTAFCSATAGTRRMTRPRAGWPAGTRHGRRRA